MRRTLAWLLVALFLTQPALAATGALTLEQADQRAKALEVFKKGRTAYKAGDYGAALEFFRQAQSIYSHEALIILALAKTLDRAGDLERAHQYYKLFLVEAPPEDPDRAATLERIAAIDKELAARPGTMLLGNLPSTAEVRIDGKVAGVDHRGGINLPAGSYKVSVRAPDRVPFQRQVLITSGRETRLDVVLLEPVEWSKLRRDHTWTWVGAGLSAASLAATAVLAVRGASMRSDFSTLFDSAGHATATGRKRFDCPATATSDDDCPALIAEGERLRDGIVSNDRLSYGFAIAGGVFAVGTVVAWFAAPPVSDQGAEQAFRLAPWSDGASHGAALHLRF